MTGMSCQQIKNIITFIIYSFIVLLISFLEAILYIKSKPNFWLYLLTCVFDAFIGACLIVFMFRHQIFNNNEANNEFNYAEIE